MEQPSGSHQTKSEQIDGISCLAVHVSCAPLSLPLFLLVVLSRSMYLYSYVCALLAFFVDFICSTHLFPSRVFIR